MFVGLFLFNGSLLTYSSHLSAEDKELIMSGKSLGLF